MGLNECVTAARLVPVIVSGRRKAFRFGNLSRFGAKKNAAGGLVLGRGDGCCWRVRSRSDSFFFKPAETCGGGCEQPEECELTRSVSKLDPVHVDVVSCHVSDQAADAVAGTVAKLGGGILQMGFQVTIKAEYTAISSLLLSSLCTGYGLRSVETRIELQSRVTKEDNLYQHLENNDIDSFPLESPGLRTPTGENPLLTYLATIRPESSLELAASSSPEVMQAFMSVVRQQMAALGFAQPEPKGFWGTVEFPDVEVSQDAFMKAIEWCMLVGYYIHHEEYRLSLERCIETPQSEPEKKDKQVEKSDTQRRGFIKKVGGVFRWFNHEN